jgi:hypothetical protein
VVGHVEQSPLVAPVGPDPLLEPLLRRGLELGRQEEAGHADHLWRRAKGADQRGQPVLIDENVVVGEGHHVAEGFSYSSVACVGEARAVLPDVAHLRHVAVAPSNRIAGR